MSAIDDYLQLVAKGSPLNNQWQQLKSNINQNIPQTTDLQDPAKMQQWSTNAALNAPMMGNILAWHGSPHKFTKFSDEAINSGEGAQAFGMGHYAASDPNIADDYYRKRLSEIKNNSNDAGLEEWISSNPVLEQKLRSIGDTDIAGQPWMQGSDSVQLKMAQLKNHNNNLTSLWNTSRRSGYDPTSNPNLYVRDIMESMMKHEQSPPSPGYLYQLNLKPSKKDLLNLGAPVYEQSDKVIGAMKEAGYNSGNISMNGFMNRSAESAYDKLRGAYGDSKLSKLLNSLGVPGHMFNGQGGAGTPNYVIYDPNNIDIIRRIRAGIDNPRSTASEWPNRLSDRVSELGLPYPEWYGKQYFRQ